MPTQAIDTRLIPLSQIDPNPDQPRKNIDPASLEELKASLQERGLINAISLQDMGNGRYRLIAGERRFRAAQALGWGEIDARIWPQALPVQELELLALVENVQRKDLSPIELANSYKLLSQLPHNLSQEEIAQKTGQGRSTIGQYAMVSNLDAKVQEFVTQVTNLTLKHLLQICRLKTPQEQIAMAEAASEKDLSVEQLKALVDKKLGPGRSEDKKKGKKEKPVSGLKFKLEGDWLEVSGKIPFQPIKGAVIAAADQFREKLSAWMESGEITEKR